LRYSQTSGHARSEVLTFENKRVSPSSGYARQKARPSSLTESVSMGCDI